MGPCPCMCLFDLDFTPYLHSSSPPWKLFSQISPPSGRLPGPLQVCTRTEFSVFPGCLVYFSTLCPVPTTVLKFVCITGLPFSFWVHNHRNHIFAALYPQHSPECTVTGWFTARVDWMIPQDIYQTIYPLSFGIHTFSLEAIYCGNIGKYCK